MMTLRLKTFEEKMSDRIVGYKICIHTGSFTYRPLYYSGRKVQEEYISKFYVNWLHLFAHSVFRDDNVRYIITDSSKWTTLKDQSQNENIKIGIEWAEIFYVPKDDFNYRAKIKLEKSKMSIFCCFCCFCCY